MKFWPMSTVVESPLMPAHLAWEIREMTRRAPSEAAYNACFDVARNTAPARDCNWAVVESTDAPHRRLFTRYPEFEEWLKFERANVIAGDNDVTCIIVDPLH